MKSYFDILGAYFDVEGFNRSQEQSETFVIPKVESYILGAIISTAFAIVAWILLLVTFGMLSIDLNIALSLLMAIGVWMVVFAGGLVSIEVGFLGVIVILGERIKNAHLGEGVFWLIPFFTSSEYVDARQQHKDTHVNQALTKGTGKVGKVDLDVDVNSAWLVDNPYRRLNVNMANIEGLVDDAIRSSVVSVIGRHTRKQVFRKHQKISKETKYGEGVSELSVEIAKEIEGNIATFGGKIVRVYISTLLPDAKLIEQERRVAIEEAQRDAERIQSQHVIDEVNKIAKETGASKEQAGQWFLAQIDKAEIKVDQNNFNVNTETLDALKVISDSVINKILGKQGD
ncbi:MAG: SPFH domain-containing protein [Candidatus Campbellbacteria bacterium]|nr:SPFH domain-containing protein [Candidatus Campbellbacteria bacterium]